MQTITTFPNNTNTKQIDELTDNSAINTNAQIYTNTIIIILLFMIVTLCVILIFCLHVNAKRAQKQNVAMATIMKMQQQRIANLSPTVDTVNTIQSEAVAMSRKDTQPEMIEDNRKEFSMSINRIHRAFTAPAPSPIHIHLQSMNNIAQLHSPVDYNTISHSYVGDVSPVVISPMLYLQRVATDPQVYQMEGKNVQTYPENESKQETDETDSDESMYDNINDNITQMGKPFVIDISEASVSENSNNENENISQVMRVDCEEKSDKPMHQLTLSAQIADASNQYRALEKILHQKQIETLGDIQNNCTGVNDKDMNVLL